MNDTISPNDSPVIWKDIPGYEGIFQVSNTGLVKRIAPGNYSTSEIKKQSTNPKGYKYMTLRNNGHERSWRVHRLVMLAFEGKCPQGKEVNHIDGNKTNNNLSNLEYVTSKQNRQHAVYVIKTALLGTKNGRSKLNDEKVREIRRLSETGLGHQALANLYHVHRSAISLIIEGKTWRHVD